MIPGLQYSLRVFFFKQKTAYEIGTGDWSSDVCSSDLVQQQMQVPSEMEKAVVIQELEIMKATLDQITPPGQDPMSDPLVQIRMKEVEIKDKELQRKAQEDEAQIMLESAKMEQRAVTDAARIESTEEIAQNRNDVNRERINVQRQAMARRG